MPGGLRRVPGGLRRPPAASLAAPPPQALADVLAEGVLVFGGASLVHGLPQQLEGELGLPVKLAEQPLTCVAEGAALALRNRALLAAYGRD